MSAECRANGPTNRDEIRATLYELVPPEKEAVVDQLVDGPEFRLFFQVEPLDPPTFARAVDVFEKLDPDVAQAILGT